MDSQDLNRAALLVRFMLGPHLLDELLQNVPPPAWSFRPSPEAWSINQVLIHLADNEAVDFVRTRLALTESGSGLLHYDQASWARELDYERESVEQALAAFSLLRSRTYALLSRVPDSAWERRLNGRPGVELTVEQTLRGDVEHDELHRSQIRQLHAAWELSVTP